MFVLCDECKNHYDDSYQRAECKGVGRSAGGSTSHPHWRTPPVEEHVGNVRSARRARGFAEAVAGQEGTA